MKKSGREADYYSVGSKMGLFFSAIKFSISAQKLIFAI